VVSAASTGQSAAERTGLPAGGPTRGARDLIAASLVMVAGSLPMFLVGTLAVELERSLGFGATALGSAVALYSLGAATAAFPLAQLADRVGAIRVLRSMALIDAVLLVMIALFARSWGLLIALLIPSGMASVGIASATNRLIARGLLPERHGLAFGVKQAAVPFATLLGGLAVPAVALTIGWRWTFAFAALLAIGSGASIRAPRRVPGRRRESDARQDIAVGPLAVLATGLGLGVFAANGLATFLVAAGVAIGVSQSTAALTAALASAAAVVVRVGVGHLADTRITDHFRFVIVMMIGGVAGYVLIAIGNASGSEVLYVIGAVVALGLGWGWNGLFNFAVVREQMHAPARASGIAQIGGRLGAVTGPFAVGVVAGWTSYATAWLVAAGAAIAAAGSVWIGSRRLTRALEPRPDAGTPG
jgi:MFS family permease